jgi:hypothetical protein
MSQFDKRLRARGATDQERADALEEYERDLQAWRSESLASIESKLREGGAQ